LGIFLIPFAPATGIYWFVYTICGLYLIIPIISPWLVKATKKEMRLLLSIWSITLFLPYLNYITGKNIYDIQGNYYFFLNYLGGFIGYLFLGVYLRKYPLTFKSKMYALLSILFFLSLGLIPIIIGYGFNRELLIIAQDNLSFTSVMFVISIFCFFQNFKLPNIIESAFNVVAKYSFGIYLIHIIVVRDIVWSFLNDNRISHPIIETPIICIISLILCIIVVWLISFLPKSKYIVGV
jgi:surface polysaccharide O-acyltransferase-like enzyme